MEEEELTVSHGEEEAVADAEVEDCCLGVSDEAMVHESKELFTLLEYTAVAAVEGGEGSELPAP